MNRRQFDVSVESDEKGDYWIVVRFPGLPEEIFGPYASLEEAIDAIDSIVAEIRGRLFPDLSCDPSF
ncbi:hypothetical protein DWU98_04270 [Dyella monticola]|uniref:Type II toxin-antitoxin system HicB family antitoxin n=1 Tax=Dyella monticola TaxID=1927958 RepID=A0A370X5K3_9GAMM|nr:hypothetical protein [Dyella monticola]RDS83560.1 hypothetical protein DWU98_04270 [Dyella monticola]